MKTLLKAKYVIGYDPQTENHSIITPGEVVFQDEQIIFIGKNYREEVDESMDLGEAIIAPGFVDLDCIGDFSHALIQSELNPQQKNDLQWSPDYFLNRRDEYMSTSEEEFKSLYAYIQAIKNGITTAMPITSVLYKKAGETYAETICAAEHARELGLRVYLSPSFISNKAVKTEDGLKLYSIEPEGESGLESAVRFCEEYHGKYNGLINACIVPERLEQVEPELLQKAKQYADYLNCPLRIHAAQSLFEYRYINTKYNQSPVEFLNQLGFLGRRTLLVHGIWTSGYSKLPPELKHDRDLKILADTGTTIVHCPVVQSTSGVVLESFGRFKRSGINMALASDTFPPDLIQNIRIGSILARHKDNDSPDNNFSEFYKAATINAANAIGRSDLGRLQVGAKADIIVIDLSKLEVGPINDPIRTMALSCTGRDVIHSIINGKFVMRDRKLAASELEEKIPELQQRAQAYFDKFKFGYLDRSDNLERESEIFTPSFPIK